MIYKLYHRLRHRLTAHTRHGIHSPFVYRFIAEGLQPKLPDGVIRALPDAPNAALLYRIFYSFGGAQVCVTGGNAVQRNTVNAVAALAGDDGDYLMVVSLQPGTEAIDILRDSEAPPPQDMLLLVLDPYRNPEATATWERAKAHAAVRMSIDLFHVGLLLFREEFKVKQDFRLRTYD